MRLSLTDAEARTPGPALDVLMAAVIAMSNPRGSSEVDVRLADVVVAWNVLRHFYPVLDGNRGGLGLAAAPAACPRGHRG